MAALPGEKSITVTRLLMLVGIRPPSTSAAVLQLSAAAALPVPTPRSLLEPPSPPSLFPSPPVAPAAREVVPAPPSALAEVAEVAGVQLRQSACSTAAEALALGGAGRCRGCWQLRMSRKRGCTGERGRQSRLK